jgi:hypothetical protein
MFARALCLIVCLAVALVRSSSADQLKIAGLKDTYPANAPISFTVSKQAPGSVTFAVAAELWIDGEFREASWDIFANAWGVVSRDPIELRDTPLNLKWNVPSVAPEIRPQPGWKYRLRVDVLTPQKEQIFSQPFSIDKTSNPAMQLTPSRIAFTFNHD